MTLEVKQLREPSAGGATLSKVYIDDKYACDILEDVVREVPGVPVEQWKVKGQTAIPTGRYRVRLETSARFGPDTLTLENVPGFQYIRIHGGNTAKDTEGCLLPGARSGVAQVAFSQLSLVTLRGRIVPAIHGGIEVWWTIVPA